MSGEKYSDCEPNVLGESAREVPRELNDLDMQINLFQEVVLELFDRLKPVLDDGKVTSEAVESKPSRPIYTIVGQKIESCNDKIVVLWNKIQYLNQNIQL